MKLGAYLKKYELSQEEFAKKFNPPVSQGLIWQWLSWIEDDSKGTRITAERAVEIEVITDGEVPRHEHRPDLYPKDKAKAA